jgi:hypothetical protein
MRSFGGSLLGYVGLPVEARGGNVLKLDSNENFFVDADFLRQVFAEALKDVDLRVYNPDVIACLKEARKVDRIDIVKGENYCSF